MKPKKNLTPAKSAITKIRELKGINPDKILLMIKEKRNRQLITSLLQQNYKVIIPESEAELFTQSFDLIMIDEYTLNKYKNIVQEIRNKEKPVFLPILLLTSQNNTTILHRELQTIINDLIQTPVGKEILQTRIKNLFHIRKLSLESEQRYHELAEKSPVGICILHKQKIAYANPAFSKLCEQHTNNIIGISFLDFIHSEDKNKVKRLFNKKIDQNQAKTGYNYSDEIRIINKQGIIKWVDFSLTNIIYKEKKAILIMLLDTTEKKKTAKKIKYISFHDKLTDLYNRNYFEEEIKRLNTERQLPLSLIMGDVNGLKLVNDAFGHQTGNQLLKKIANVLKQACRKEDIIARWGGDEFVVLLPNTPYEIGNKICDRIRKACAAAQEDPIRLSIALGVATKDNFEINMKEVLGEAENRMYKNKIAGSESVRNSIIASLENTLLEKSHETQDHAERISKLAIKFGKSLNLSTVYLDELKLLSKLHDIGKVSIPERILKKPGKLTTEEFEKIKGHPESGYRIVKAIPELASIAESILSHHERWDGTGYPQGLSGEEIPYTTRIISIIDSYDVMTHERSYKKAISKEKALAEIKRCAGSQFDPELAKVFINMIS